MWDLSFSCGIFIWNEICLPSLQCWTEQDLCYHPETGSVLDPHYDAAALPMDLPGVKVMILFPLIQSHDLSYHLMGFDCWSVILLHCLSSLRICEWCDWPLSVLVGLFGLDKGCRSRVDCETQSSMVNGIEVKGDTGLRRGWGLDTRGTWGKWNLKAHLIHQSGLAQIVWDGFCWWLLFPDGPCLSINELHHWFVVLATRLCLGPGWGVRGESSQLCCSAVTFTQGTDPDLFSVWEMF